ncbi:MAG: glycosyl hydrolase family 28 protein [Candidatus Cryptobacteroides sp.]
MKKSLFACLLSALFMSSLPLEAQSSGIPYEIEPVSAPFAVCEFSRPEFPDESRVVKMKRRGMSTDRIQAAIDDLSLRGGGTVIIPAGIWNTGRIEMKSNINLHLSEGCELHFSGRIKDYIPAVFTRDEGVEVYSLGAFIYANGQENIALTGKGKVVGPSTDCEIYRNNPGVNIEKAALKPLDQRVFDTRSSGVLLPKTFAPIRCSKVFVEDVTFEKGLYWNVVPQYCDQVIIRGITVSSYGHGRTDGIDIDSSKDVLIEYCSLDCQDDCYTMKSGRGEDGKRVGIPTERVVIRNCLALRGAGGIVCGTEIAGGVRDIYMCDCIFDGTSQAFRFKTRRPRGGFVENVYIERVKANVLRQAFYIDMLGSARWVGELASRYPKREITALTPRIRNISIHDVFIDSCSELIDVCGLPEVPLENIFFGNASAKCETIGRVRDAIKFSVKDIRVESADTVLTIDNCDYASFFGFSNISVRKPVEIIKEGDGECKYLNIQNYPLEPVSYNSIFPGEVWLDTEGKPIQAHGFQVIWDNGKYYWYGEDKTHCLFGTNRMFGGVHCYSSTDFYNWKDEGLIVSPDIDPDSPLHQSQKLERPHILHCPKTGKYVCWLKAQANDGYFTILQADSFMGPYTFVRNLKPNGFAVGDFDMYSDPQTGKGYVWFERPHWENICSELSDDYTDVNGVFSEHFAGLTPPLTREAAAHFVMNGRHYIYTSGTTGYTPNESEVAVFDDYHGDYTVLGNPHIGDKFAHSFCSQITSVIKIPGKDLYVAMADRWQPHTNNTDIPQKEYQSFLRRYKQHRPYPRDFETPKPADRRYVLVNPNQDVYKATYVFLPIVIKDGIPMIEWKDEWRLEDY